MNRNSSFKLDSFIIKKKLYILVKNHFDTTSTSWLINSKQHIMNIYKLHVPATLPLTQ